jgi:hypothetical protein
VTSTRSVSSVTHVKLVASSLMVSSPGKIESVGMVSSVYFHNTPNVMLSLVEELKVQKEQANILQYRTIHDELEDKGQ